MVILIKLMDLVKILLNPNNLDSLKNLLHFAPLRLIFNFNRFVIHLHLMSNLLHHLYH